MPESAKGVLRAIRCDDFLPERTLMKADLKGRCDICAANFDAIL